MYSIIKYEVKYKQYFVYFKWNKKIHIQGQYKLKYKQYSYFKYNKNKWKIK